MILQPLLLYSCLKLIAHAAVIHKYKKVKKNGWSQLDLPTHLVYKTKKELEKEMLGYANQPYEFLGIRPYQDDGYYLPDNFYELLSRQGRYKQNLLSHQSTQMFDPYLLNSQTPMLNNHQYLPLTNQSIRQPFFPYDYYDYMRSHPMQDIIYHEPMTEKIERSEGESAKSGMVVDIDYMRSHPMQHFIYQQPMMTEKNERSEGESANSGMVVDKEAYQGESFFKRPGGDDFSNNNHKEMVSPPIPNYCGNEKQCSICCKLEYFDPFEPLPKWPFYMLPTASEHDKVMIALHSCTECDLVDEEDIGFIEIDDPEFNMELDQSLDHSLDQSLNYPSVPNVISDVNNDKYNYDRYFDDEHFLDRWEIERTYLDESEKDKPVYNDEAKEFKRYSNYPFEGEYPFDYENEKREFIEKLRREEAYRNYLQWKKHSQDGDDNSEVVISENNNPTDSGLDSGPTDSGLDSGLDSGPTIAPLVTDFVEMEDKYVYDSGPTIAPLVTDFVEMEDKYVFDRYFSDEYLDQTYVYDDDFYDFYNSWQDSNPDYPFDNQNEKREEFQKILREQQMIDYLEWKKKFEERDSNLIYTEEEKKRPNESWLTLHRNDVYEEEPDSNLIYTEEEKKRPNESWLTLHHNDLYDPKKKIYVYESEELDQEEPFIGSSTPVERSNYAYGNPHSFNDIHKHLSKDPYLAIRYMEQSDKINTTETPKQSYFWDEEIDKVKENNLHEPDRSSKLVYGERKPDKAPLQSSYYFYGNPIGSRAYLPHNFNYYDVLGSGLSSYLPNGSSFYVPNESSYYANGNFNNSNLTMVQPNNNEHHDYGHYHHGLKKEEDKHHKEHKHHKKHPSGPPFDWRYPVYGAYVMSDGSVRINPYEFDALSWMPTANKKTHQKMNYAPLKTVLLKSLELKKEYERNKKLTKKYNKKHKH